MFSQSIVASVLLGIAAAAPQNWGPPGHGGPPHPTPTPVHPTHPGWPGHTTEHHTWASSSSFYPSSSAAAPAATVTAAFDDLTPLTPVGIYEGLDFEGFNVARLTTSGTVKAKVAGIVPQSPPNVAYYTSTATESTQLLVKYGSGSKYTSFDLESFYFACATITAKTAASFPESCALTIAAYDSHSKLLAKKKYSFVIANNKLAAQMQKVVPPSDFNGASFITFETSGAATKPYGTFFDTFVYTLHK